MLDLEQIAHYQANELSSLTIKDFATPGLGFINYFKRTTPYYKNADIYVPNKKSGLEIKEKIANNTAILFFCHIVVSGGLSMALINYFS